MFNEEICLMLQIRFCKPALLYQNMLLLVMPGIDFKLYLPPHPQKIKTNQKKTPAKTGDKDYTMNYWEVNGGQNFDI